MNHSIPKCVTQSLWKWGIPPLVGPLEATEVNAPLHVNPGEDPGSSTENTGENRKPRSRGENLEVGTASHHRQQVTHAAPICLQIILFIPHIAQFILGLQKRQMSLKLNPSSSAPHPGVHLQLRETSQEASRNLAPGRWLHCRQTQRRKMRGLTLPLPHPWTTKGRGNQGQTPQALVLCQPDLSEVLPRVPVRLRPWCSPRAPAHSHT